MQWKSREKDIICNSFIYCLLNVFSANADSRCCFACELMINELSFDAAQGRVTNSAGALHKLQADCNRLGSQFENVQTCRAWVQLNYVQIWMYVSNMVQQGQDPHARTICTQINQCPSELIKNCNRIFGQTNIFNLKLLLADVVASSMSPKPTTMTLPTSKTDMCNCFLLRLKP